MKKVLIVYIQMIVGGSTTSLLNLLHEFDYSKYDVDLLLYKNEGELLEEIPEQVHLLEPAFKSQTRKAEVLKKILYPYALISFIKGSILSKMQHNPMLKNQIMWPSLAKMARRENREYDIAISFLEGWPTYYVANIVKAKRKITWIHVDYEKAHLVSKYDEKIYEKFDSIVSVSDIGCQKLKKLFPKIEKRISVVENILSRKATKKRASEDINNFCVDNNFINIVSVCRLDKQAKGLDRAIEAFSQLKRMDIRWYIIGEGMDESFLKNKVAEKSLEKTIYFLGNQINPFPFEIQMDAFFLPSRYEGKPMAVTEAMLLGIPALVTNYASASEQINDGFNGILFENSYQGILNGLESITIENLNHLKDNLRCNPIEMVNPIQRIYKLME